MTDGEKLEKAKAVAARIEIVAKQYGITNEEVLEAAERKAGIGEAKDVGGVAGERLRSFIERIERLEEEKKALLEDIKECYAEAKGVGFDTKTMKKIIKLRKMDSDKRSEEAQLLDLYASAIGMQHVLL